MTRGLRLLFGAAVAIAVTSLLWMGSDSGECYELVPGGMVQVDCTKNGWVWILFVLSSTFFITLRLLRNYLHMSRSNRRQSSVSSTSTNQEGATGPCA